MILALWLATSCSGGGGTALTDGGTTPDGGSPDGGTPPTHFITYTFNGTTYSGSLLATATLQPNAAGGNALGIVATDNNGDELAIAVEPATPQSMIAAGTYNTGSAAPFAGFQFTMGAAGTWAANGTTGSGRIDITSLTANEIAGTFSATMMGAGSNPGSGAGALTNGKFDLALP